MFEEKRKQCKLVFSVLILAFFINKKPNNVQLLADGR